jgi:hypothetical protein
MATPEMPIFTRTFDLLAWLLPATNHFPRAHRQTVTKRLIDAAFDLRERLEEANVQRRDARRTALRAADEALARLRLYLRLAGRFGWLTEGQYGHVSTMIAEIGRLLGGWHKASADDKTAVSPSG